jgi:hypothetical protein
MYSRKIRHKGPLAQLVLEHVAVNRKVVGSIPTRTAPTLAQLVRVGDCRRNNF